MSKKKKDSVIMNCNLTARKLLLICVLSAVFINEYLVYHIQTWNWPAFPSVDRDLKKNVVMLFVSDPQITGYIDEPAGLGYLTRWDSDSYLQKSFGLVLEYAQPDVIIFLGDLLDDGSRADQSGYESSLNRFNSIFTVETAVKKIYIAGDNDIGGEHRDRRSKFKIMRFEENFQKLVGVTKVGFIDFIKLDIVRSGELDVQAGNTAQLLAEQMTQPFRILVNHENVIAKVKMSIYPILHHVRPHLIFSGDWHMSRHFHCEKCMSDTIDYNWWPLQDLDLTDIDEFLEINIRDTADINEFMVPTCNYRMGVRDMGYGLAILENTGRMRYTVLWQLRRVPVLLSYLAWLSAILLLTMYIMFCQTPRDKRN